MSKKSVSNSGRRPKNAAELAALVDHTLLKPEATEADVSALVADGISHGTYSVCVSPTFIKHAKKAAGDRLKIATVVGFPSGKHTSAVKAAEARAAIADGADEIDMVIDIGKAKEGKFDDVQRDIEAVREATTGAVLKVIVESAALSDKETVAVCKAAEAAGANFVKTSTGYHPAGGATVHDVALMAETVAPRLGVKASGGIKTKKQAEELLAAGATRLGLSGTAAILDEYTSADGDRIVPGLIGAGAEGVGAADVGGSVDGNSRRNRSDANAAQGIADSGAQIDEDY